MNGSTLNKRMQIQLSNLNIKALSIGNASVNVTCQKVWQPLFLTKSTKWHLQNTLKTQENISILSSDTTTNTLIWKLNVHLKLNYGRRYERPCHLQNTANTHKHRQRKAKEQHCKITQSSKRHAPLSFVLLSAFHSFSVVLFPHLSYLQTLQTRIPACNQDKKTRFMQ